MKSKKTLEKMFAELSPHIDYMCPSYSGWTISLIELEDIGLYDHINKATLTEALEECYIELKKRKIKI